MSVTLTLTAAQIASIASLHAATPADKFTRDTSPTLTAIRVTVEPNGQLEAVATDRYIATRLRFTLDPEHAPAEAVSLLLDSKDWQAAAKAAKTDKLPIELRITGGDDTAATVSFVSITQLTIGQYMQRIGNYPPIDRFIPTSDADLQPLAGMPHVNPALFTRATAAHTPNEVSTKDRNKLPWQISRDAGQGDSAHIVLTAHTAADTELVSLLQPFKILR